MNALVFLQEEGEVLGGRILAYGVAMRSKVFMNGTVDLQQAMIGEMLKKSTERSYLPLLTYTFVTEFIRTVRNRNLLVRNRYVL